jgi:hypothetical protein
VRRLVDLNIARESCGHSIRGDVPNKILLDGILVLPSNFRRSDSYSVTLTQRTS